MDAARFDRLAAALAHDPSRRAILRLIAGGGFFALLGGGRPSETVARKKNKSKKKRLTCKGDKKRCGNRCIPKTNCCTSHDCPAGDICEQAVCDRGRCATVPALQGSPCDTGQFCIVGETCDGNRACQGTQRSCGDGIDCTSDPNHCGACGRRCLNQAPVSCGDTGVCVEGSCQKWGTGITCRPAACLSATRLRLAGKCDGNGSCAPSEIQDCAIDHFCESGQCIPKRGNGEACQTPAQCASNICVANVCCAEFCAVGQSCVGGTCQG